MAKSSWRLHTKSQEPQVKCLQVTPGAKTIEKKKNSTRNKSQTQRARAYEVTSFLSTDCEFGTETCSKDVYSLRPRSSAFSLFGVSASSIHSFAHFPVLCFMFSLLHLLQSFSIHVLTMSVSLLLFSHLSVPHLPLFLFHLSWSSQCSISLHPSQHSHLCP